MMNKKIVFFGCMLIGHLASAQVPSLADSIIFKEIAQALCPIMSDPEVWKPRDENTTFEGLSPFDHPNVMASLTQMIYAHRVAFGVSDTLSWDTFQHILRTQGDYWLREPRVVMYLMRDCKNMLSQMVRASNNTPSELAARFREFASLPIERVEMEEQIPDTTAGSSPTPIVEETYKSIKGKIQRIDTKRYVMIALQDSLGKTHEFIWFNRFYNSEHLLLNRKKAIGKWVRASGYRQEFLNPRRNDYDDYFVLDNIEFLDE